MTVTDGFIVDEQTGEILGMESVEAEWVPETPEEVEWLMERIQRHRFEAASHRARIAAITQSLEDMARRAERQADWLAARYEGALWKFAEEQLAGRRRTYSTPYGDLKIRKRPRRVVPADLDRCIEWCEEHAPEAVKVQKSVLVSRLPGGADLPACFEVVPERDILVVDTKEQRKEEE